MINVWMMIRHWQQIVVATTHALEWATSPPPLLSVKGHKCIQATAGNSLLSYLSSWIIRLLASVHDIQPVNQKNPNQSRDWMDVPFVIRQPMAMDMGADTTSSCFTHTQEHRKVWQSGCVVVASCSVTSREASDWWTTLANQDADATHHCLDSLRQVSCWCKS